MLSSDDMEVGPGNIRIKVGTSSVGTCLVNGVEIGGYERRACRASVIRIKLCRDPKVVQCGKEIS